MSATSEAKRSMCWRLAELPMASNPSAGSSTMLNAQERACRNGREPLLAFGVDRHGAPADHDRDAKPCGQCRVANRDRGCDRADHPGNEVVIARVRVSERGHDAAIHRLLQEDGAVLGPQPADRKGSAESQREHGQCSDTQRLHRPRALRQTSDPGDVVLPHRTAAVRLASVAGDSPVAPVVGREVASPLPASDGTMWCAESQERSLIGAAIGLLVLAALAGRCIQLTHSLLSASTREQLDDQAAEFRCLEQRIEQKVPSSSSVFFGRDLRNDPTGVWKQRAIEGSYPRYRVEPVRSRAKYAVTVGSHGGGCAGLEVRVAVAR